MLEGLLHPLLDLPSLLMQVFEPSEMFHPGLFLRGCFQFFLDRLGDELAQRNAAFRGHRLGAPEQKIRDFEGGFHADPYYHIYGDKPLLAEKDRVVAAQDA